MLVLKNQDLGWVESLSCCQSMHDLLKVMELTLNVSG